MTVLTLIAIAVLISIGLLRLRKVFVLLSDGTVMEREDVATAKRCAELHAIYKPGITAQVKAGGRIVHEVTSLK